MAFFNEWFLRDTSKKIRNGKKTRAKEGKVMTTYPTYTMMVSLIDRIEVSEDKKITIYYKFNILNMRKLNDEEELINVG